MKNLKIFTLIFIFISQIHAMDINQPDPFDSLPGAKPLIVKFKENIEEDSIEEFKTFRIYAQELKNQILEYKIIKSFANKILKDPSGMYVPGMGKDFSMIENWVSITVDGFPEERIINVPFNLLAETLNINAHTKVTEDDMVNHLNKTKEKLKETNDYYLLRNFAQRVLKIEHHELHQLDNWVLGNHMPMQNELTTLNGDLITILKLVEIKAKRDIVEEFASFKKEYQEKEDRVLLKKDFENFTFQKKKMMPMVNYVSEEIINQSNCPIFEQAFPKDFNISLLLVEQKHEQFKNLIQNADRLRVYNGFVVCAQGSGKEVPHVDLKKFSLVEIRDGMIYQDEALLETESTIWVLDPHGELCIYPQKKKEFLGSACHSYFFQSEEKVGLPIACGGHLEAKGGKITKINNASGHYMPTTLNFVCAVNYLNKKGIIAEGVAFDIYNSGINSLKDVLSIANMIEL